nr:MAG TPA: hypothetical protein [Crassvirales sp.]
MVLHVGGCSIDKVKNSFHHLKPPSDFVSHSHIQLARQNPILLAGRLLGLFPACNLQIKTQSAKYSALPQ